MGNSTSKEDKKVDEGSSYTNGLYSNVIQDYDKKVVRKLIMSRKLAPFYKGMDEIDTVSENMPKTTNKPSSSSPQNAKNNQSVLYAGAIECPICFLYYPSNINYSKCCDQPICTECFVQIKRTDALLPACCPFCVQPNFGIIYHLPSTINQSHQRYSAFFSASSPCYHAITKNIVSRSNSGHDLPPPPSSSSNDKSSKRPSLKQNKSHIRRSLVKKKPSMIVLVDQIRPTLDTPSSLSPVTAESTLPIRRYYATDLTMETPSFEDWMVMEAVRRSLQDQEISQGTSSSSTNAPPTLLRHQTSNTPTTSEDSSILC